MVLEAAQTGTTSSTEASENVVTTQRSTRVLTSVAVSVSDSDGINYLFHQPSETYELGEVVNHLDLPKYLMLEVSQAGTTSSTDLTIS